MLEDVYEGKCVYCGKMVECKVVERKLITFGCPCYHIKHKHGDTIRVEFDEYVATKVQGFLNMVNTPDWEL